MPTPIERGLIKGGRSPTDLTVTSPVSGESPRMVSSLPRVSMAAEPPGDPLPVEQISSDEPFIYDHSILRYFPTFDGNAYIDGDGNVRIGEDIIACVSPPNGTQQASLRNTVPRLFLRDVDSGPGFVTGGTITGSYVDYGPIASEGSGETGETEEVRRLTKENRELIITVRELMKICDSLNQARIRTLKVLKEACTQTPDERVTVDHVPGGRRIWLRCVRKHRR